MIGNIALALLALWVLVGAGTGIYLLAINRPIERYDLKLAAMCLPMGPIPLIAILYVNYKDRQIQRALAADREVL